MSGGWELRSTPCGRGSLTPVSKMPVSRLPPGACFLRGARSLRNAPACTPAQVGPTVAIDGGDKVARAGAPARFSRLPPYLYDEDRLFRGERESPMPVLVLNASLQPLSVIPERRLVVLLSKQKVTFVDEAVRQLIENGIAARQLQSEEPVIVQLLANVRVPRMVLRPTRANILLRDEETCQYCGKHSRELTLDHVVPRSRGGSGTCGNPRNCLRACNGRKGNPKLKNVRMPPPPPPKPPPPQSSPPLFPPY